MKDTLYNVGAGFEVFETALISCVSISGPNKMLLLPTSSVPAGRGDICSIFECRHRAPTRDVQSIDSVLLVHISTAARNPSGETECPHIKVVCSAWR